MDGEKNSPIVDLMESQRFAEALVMLRAAIEFAPGEWSNYYMAGQCARFLNDFGSAIAYLRQATKLKPEEPAVLLALGIALQLTDRLQEAAEVLRNTIALDPDYDLAFNSLALTLEKQGHLDLAFDTYEAGLQALARRIARRLQNRRSNKIYEHHESEFLLWFEYATFGALYLCSLDREVQGIALPSATLALEEERSEHHRGLYWIDQVESDGKLVRLFLPNYFNTFREAFRSDRAYATLIDNKGLLLEQQGSDEAAKKCFDEAQYFFRRNGEKENR